ncbi:septum formation family protein [Mycobacterium sp. NPDC006124]|uniref:septum formation family protein n=1 Tax=Mycobacterium sp. NPDC006124 TaxID=3156729 RepID=UPI00339FE000
MRNPQTGAPDLASVLAALDQAGAGPHDEAKRLQTRAHRRGILTLVMIVLLVGGVIQLLTSTPEAPRTADGGSRASIVFSNAGTGTCLSWPPDAPDKPSFVQCRSDHMFEVAKPVDMNGFGEPCQLAVREYLGTHYDPNSRFTISVLWAGDADGTNTGARNLLCGLQLLGKDGKPTPFKGRIVELDQSKIWVPGTCLGLDGSSRSTDIPVDCSAPHGLEVTGSANLAERFTGGLPSDAEQRSFITEACTRATDAYLAPARLSTSGLSLGFDPVSAVSWAAGSRQVSCGIGKPAEQGWAPRTGSVRTSSPADLPPLPVAPPPPPPPPPPSTSDPAPPPVYEEPLVPIGPPPSETPPAAPTTTASTTEAPTSTVAPPSETPTTATTPPLGPPPGPATPPSETSTASPPGILEIPGLPPITLPGYVPPEPAPPAAG